MRTTLTRRALAGVAVLGVAAGMTACSSGPSTAQFCATATAYHQESGQGDNRRLLQQVEKNSPDDIAGTVHDALRLWPADDDSLADAILYSHLNKADSHQFADDLDRIDAYRKAHC